LPPATAPANPSTQRQKPEEVAPTVSRLTLSLTSMAAGGFAIGTTEFVTMGLLPEVTGDVGVSIPRGGWLITAYALGVVVGAPLLAVLTARLDRTRLLLALMSAFTVGNVLSALAPGFGTLVAARFLSGLPHGAYFGIASLVAATLADPARRGRAIAAPMFGITVANVVGVPVSSFLGQQLGWRAAYWFVAVVGALTVLAVRRWVPSVPAAQGAGARRELGALARPQVWLTMAVGAIGFGGMFAVYSYISPVLTEAAGWSSRAVPIGLALFGIGMTLGNVLGGALVDRSVRVALVVGFVATLTTLALFPLAVRTVWTAGVAVFALGVVGSVTVPALQTRLMDVAGDAASLGASLNHSALNLANAAGAFLGGLVLSAGLGWTSPALVGAGLAVIGLALVTVSLTLESRGRRRDRQGVRQRDTGRPETLPVG
jgi:DHA1 family inner membrane transport protein